MESEEGQSYTTPSWTPPAKPPLPVGMNGQWWRMSHPMEKHDMVLFAENGQLGLVSIKAWRESGWTFELVHLLTDEEYSELMALPRPGDE